MHGFGASHFQHDFYTAPRANDQTSAAHTLSISPALAARAWHGVSQSRFVWRLPGTNPQVASEFEAPDGSRAGPVSVAAIRGTIGTDPPDGGRGCGRSTHG